MRLGLFGKHPVRGDFLQSGLPEPLLRGLEGWLDQALRAAREGIGPNWKEFWGHAVCLRFWIGEGVLGHAMCGVFAPSNDKVGRDYPLLLIAFADEADRAAPPPVIDTEQNWYAAAEAHLRTVLATREGPLVSSADAMISGLCAPVASQWAPSAGPSDFWAMRETDGSDVAAALMSDIALTDHRRSLAARSYFWTSGGTGAPARVHAGAGLPGGPVLSWLATPAERPRVAAVPVNNPFALGATAESERVEADPTEYDATAPAEPLPAEVWEDSPFGQPEVAAAGLGLGIVPLRALSEMLSDNDVRASEDAPASEVAADGLLQAPEIEADAETPATVAEVAAAKVDEAAEFPAPLTHVAERVDDDEPSTGFPVADDPVSDGMLNGDADAPAVDEPVLEVDDQRSAPATDADPQQAGRMT